MKKYIGMLIGLLLLAGCANDEFKNDANTEGVKSFTSLTAIMGEMADTRAHITESAVSGRKSVAWDEGDEILVFSDTDKDFKTYTLTSIENGAGEFSGQKVSGSKKFYALYPAEGWSIDADDENLLHFDMSKCEVAGEENNFKFKAPMVAVSDGNSFSFKQTVGMIHISIGNIHELKKVELRGNDGETLTGTASIGLSQDRPTLQADGQGMMAVSADVSKNLDDTSAELYFIVPPTTFTKGFFINIEGSDGENKPVSVKKSTDKSLEVMAGTVLHFSLVDVNAELEEIERNRVYSFVISLEDNYIEPASNDSTMTRVETSSVTELAFKKIWMEHDSISICMYRDGPGKPLVTLPLTDGIGTSIGTFTGKIPEDLKGGVYKIVAFVPFSGGRLCVYSGGTGKVEDLGSHSFTYWIGDVQINNDCLEWTNTPVKYEPLILHFPQGLNMRMRTTEYYNNPIDDYTLSKGINFFFYNFNASDMFFYDYWTKSELEWESWSGNGRNLPFSVTHQGPIEWDSRPGILSDVLNLKGSNFNNVWGYFYNRYIGSGIQVLNVMLDREGCLTSDVYVPLCINDYSIPDNETINYIRVPSYYSKAGAKTPSFFLYAGDQEYFFPGETISHFGYDYKPYTLKSVWHKHIGYDWRKCRGKIIDITQEFIDANHTNFISHNSNW